MSYSTAKSSTRSERRRQAVYAGEHYSRDGRIVTSVWTSTASSNYRSEIGAVTASIDGAFKSEEPRLQQDNQVRALLRRVRAIYCDKYRDGRVSTGQIRMRVGELTVSINAVNPSRVTMTGALPFILSEPFTRQGVEAYFENGKKSVTVECEHVNYREPRYIYITPEFWPMVMTECPAVAQIQNKPRVSFMEWARCHKQDLAKCPKVRIRRTVSVLDDGDEIIEYLKVLPTMHNTNPKLWKEPLTFVEKQWLSQVAHYLAVQYQLVLDESEQYPVLTHFDVQEDERLLDFTQGICDATKSGLWTLDVKSDREICDRTYGDLVVSARVGQEWCERFYGLIQDVWQN